MRRLGMVLGLGACALSLVLPSAYAAPESGASSAITDRWQRLGGSRSYLGQPIGAETPGPVEGTRIRRFAGGTLYASPSGAWLLQGAIAERFATLDPTEQARLGAPLGDEQDDWQPGSRQNRFTAGTIHWSPETGAQLLTGPIDERYASDPALRTALGLPIDGETAGTTGSRQVRFQHGEMHWTPQFGAQAVQGAIAERYRTLPPAVLGPPTTDERPGAVPGSRVSSFTGGAIVWSPATGAQPVRGAIAERYTAVGAEASELGLPTSDERAAPGGAVSVFQYGRIGYDSATRQTRIEVTRSPESSPLWTECRLTLEGTAVNWPANNRTLTIVTGSGPAARLKLYLRRNSACGYDRVLDTAARTTGTPTGTFALTGAYPNGADPYLIAPARIAMEVDPDADLQPAAPDTVPSVHGAGDAGDGVSIGTDQVRTLLETFRPYDTITVVG